MYYGTETHLRNVEKGYAKNLDHSLLAQVYSLVRISKSFYCDKKFKPMRISLRAEDRLLSQQTSPSLQVPNRKGRAVMMTSYEEKVKEILEKAGEYHKAYYEAKTFGGPSLYFHQRALDTRQTPDSLTHLEYVYATLASWGMQKMGPKGAKMQYFDTYRQSILCMIEKIKEAQKFDIRDMNEHKWVLIKEIFQGINVMASSISLVGNSKVMHHMLPNIVPPIDHEYTLDYLRGNKNIKADLDDEWQIMMGIISDFFIPIASDNDFEKKALNWIERKNEYPWDTSILKVVDNLVIGRKKEIKRKSWDR